jgi:hypothetical protein
MLDDCHIRNLADREAARISAVTAPTRTGLRFRRASARTHATMLLVAALKALGLGAGIAAVAAVIVVLVGPWLITLTN